MTNAGGTTFTLVCQNNSSQSGDFCVFQQDPSLGVTNAQSVAWLVEPAHPTTRVTFCWQASYDFAWSKTGKLAEGVVAASAQVWPADLETSNQVTLTYVGGAFTFENQVAGSAAGNLYLMQNGTIPADTAAAGIGMGGAATFLAQAEPNISMIFTPSPHIWLAFGDYTTGEVLGSEVLGHAVEIPYAPNVYSMAAILNADNTWTVDTTLALNKAFLLAQAEDSAARWGAEARS